LRRKAYRQFLADGRCQIAVRQVQSDGWLTLSQLLMGPSFRRVEIVSGHERWSSWAYPAKTKTEASAGNEVEKEAAAAAKQAALKGVDVKPSVGEQREAEAEAKICELEAAFQRRGSGHAHLRRQRQLLQ